MKSVIHSFLLLLMPLLASAQLFTWEGVPGQPTTKLFTLQSDWSGTVTVTAFYSDGGQRVPDRLQPSFTKTGLTISALFSGTATSGLPNRTFVAIATGGVVRIRGNLVLKALADQVFAVGQASATTPGYLSAQDWNTFNNKQNALGFTPLNPANNLAELISSAMAVRANLNIKSMASQENFQVAITGGNINNISTLTGASGVFSTYLQAGGVRLTPINNNSQNLVLGYDQSSGKTFINSWNGKALNLNPSGGLPVNVGAALNVSGPLSTSNDVTSTGEIKAPYLTSTDYASVNNFYASGPGLFDNVVTFSNTGRFNYNLEVTGTASVTGTSTFSPFLDSDNTAAVVVAPQFDSDNANNLSGVHVNATMASGGAGRAALYRGTVDGAERFAVDGNGWILATGLSITPASVNYAATTSGVYAVSETQQHIDVDATGGAITTILPNSSSVVGKSFYIKRKNSGSNNVTVSTYGGTIDGASSITLTGQYKYLSVRATNTGYDIMGSN